MLEELAVMMKQQLAGQQKRNILELEGLGAEIWEGLDAREYVQKERASWEVRRHNEGRLL